MRFNGTTVPNYRDDTYDTAEVSRYESSSGSDIEVEAFDVTENGTYTAPNGKAYSPVNVNVTGGGGSSDFSTASVTVVANGIMWHSTMPFVYEEGAMGGSSPATICTVPSATNENVSSLIALYKGNAFINFTATSGSVVVTGNGMNLGDDTLLITGDCTITIS